MNNDSNNNNPILILPTPLSVLWHATIYRSNANVVTLLRQIMNDIKIWPIPLHFYRLFSRTLSIHRFRPFLFKIASMWKLNLNSMRTFYLEEKEKEKERQFIELCSTSLSSKNNMWY